MAIGKHGAEIVPQYRGCEIKNKREDAAMKARKLRRHEDAFDTTGKRIRYLREGEGLSQAELGDKLGVGSSAVSQWELHGKLPGLDRFALLARILNTTTDYLLLLVDNPDTLEDAAPTFIAEEVEEIAAALDKMPASRRVEILEIIHIVERFEQREQERWKESMKRIFDAIEEELGPEERRRLMLRLGGSANGFGGLFGQGD